MDQGYDFVIHADSSVRIIDVDVIDVYDEIEAELLEGEIENDDGVYVDGGERDEVSRRGYDNNYEYGVSSSQARNGRGNDGLYPKKPFINSGRNMRESGEDGGKPSFRDAKVKPWKSYVSVSKIQEKIKFGFKLTASKKAILNSKGINLKSEERW